MRVRFLKIIAISTISLFLAQLALAQATNGSIRGMVTDPNGAVMPRAVVNVKNAGTGF